MRQPDAESPAGGVSSSVNDVATWLAMVLNEGKAADGTQVVDPAALRAALTPHMRAVTGSADPAESSTAGPASTDTASTSATTQAARVRIGHSGAFALGAGTTFLGIPDLDLGIVVLTNAAPIGAAEALSQEFADVAEFGSIQHDWRTDLRHRVRRDERAGRFAGRRRPRRPHRLRRRRTAPTSGPTRTTTSARPWSPNPAVVWC